MQDDRRNSKRSALVKVCDDCNGPNGIPTAWYYDKDVKSYKRFQGDIFLSLIGGKNLPDPYQLAASRKRTIETLIKHVSSEKLEKIAEIAVEKGKNPEDEILKLLEQRAEPAKAIYDMWDHYQEVKDA